MAPTDVVFDAHTVVQPDVFVVCDRTKITPENIKGAPDLVVEVVSPRTEVKDRREKFRLYERWGVREYLIVFPERGYLERYVLAGGRYGAPEIFTVNERLALTVLPVEWDLSRIFQTAFEHRKGSAEPSDREAGGGTPAGCLTAPPWAS